MERVKFTLASFLERKEEILEWNIINSELIGILRFSTIDFDKFHKAIQSFFDSEIISEGEIILTIQKIDRFQIPVRIIFPGISRTNLTTLYPHQVDAVRWMKLQEDVPLLAGGKKVSGGVLADAMGLGKTKSMTAFISIQKPCRTLIITPKSVLFQWIRELNSQGHTVFFMEPNKAKEVIIDVSGRAYISKKSIDHRSLPKIFVGLANLGMIRPHPEPSHGLETSTPYSETSEALTPFKYIVWDRIVIDEAHTLRNGFRIAGDTTFGVPKVLKYVRVHRLLRKEGAPCWGLTGTPVQNRVSDIASLFLWIGLPISKATKSEHLQDMIENKLFRRSGENLNPITKEAIRFPNDPYENHKIAVKYSSFKERDFYSAAAGEIAERFETLQESGYGGVKAEDNILVLLNFLRFLSAHPQMYINAYNKRYTDNLVDWIGPCSKVDMIRDKMVELVEEDESVIIFVHFNEEAAQIGSRAEMAGYRNIFYLNGSCSNEERDWIVQDSKQKIEKGDKVVIIASIMTCGEGLNLQFMRNAIIATPDWNPSNEEQAIARLHRIGQLKQVRVWRYYHEAIDKVSVNIDVYMHALQKKKDAIVQTMIVETPNAAWTFQAMDIPGYPGTASTFFDLLDAPVLRGRRLGVAQAVLPVPRAAGISFSNPTASAAVALPTSRRERAALLAAAANRRI
jgi:SNF2 family DNA or RNA helicase